MGEFATVTPAGEARPQRGGWAERIRELLETGRAAILGRDGVATLPPDPALDDAELPLREDV